MNLGKLYLKLRKLNCTLEYAKYILVTFSNDIVLITIEKLQWLKLKCKHQLLGTFMIWSRQRKWC